jgi:hypothetical protein
MAGRKYVTPTGIFRMARISSLAEAIKSAVRDGDTVALEGFTISFRMRRATRSSAKAAKD